MLFKTPLLDPFGIYFFHILYSRQLKRLKDVQRPLFFQNSVMGRQGTCIKMKASLTMLKALSLSGMKTGYFLLHISASNIHLFLCSNGRCMTWVHEGTSKSRKCTSRAKSCPSPRHGKGSEKQKRPILTMEFLRNPTKPTKRMESLWNFLMFLVSFFFLADTWSLCLFAFRCPWSNVQRAARGALTEQSCHVSDLFLENGQTSVRKSKVHEYPRSDWQTRQVNSLQTCFQVLLALISQPDFQGALIAGFP